MKQMENYDARYRKRLEGGAGATGSWPLGHSVDFNFHSKSKRISNENCSEERLLRYMLVFIS